MHALSFRNLLKISASRYSTLIQTTDCSGLRTITMVDLKTRNALSLQMMKDLQAALQLDERTRTVVLKSSNPNVFSSGHNLKELSQGVATQKNVFASCTELMQTIKDTPVPVFAAVDGLAAAAGCQVVAACDFAICTERSSFSTPGATFGLFCSTPSIPLSRKVGRTVASYMVLTGQPISAVEALAARLVVKVVKDSEEMDRLTTQIHDQIASKSRSVIQLGKKFFNDQLELPYMKALQEGENVMVRNLQLEDGQEGLESFKTKRKAKWTHK